MKNLKTRKLSKKLNYIKIESFLVRKTKKSINYKLDLLKNAKVFLVFYILLLINEFNYIFIEHILFSFIKRETI